MDTAAEHCRLSRDFLAELAIEPGQQIRVVTPDRGARFRSAVYTVEGVTSGSDRLQMGETARQRLGVGTNTPLTVRPYATHPDYGSRKRAESDDEFYEKPVDAVKSTELVVTAPHGGWIEYRTDEQAATVADTLDVTEWSCLGFNSGGGAYDRWHITSTDIDPDSFPNLARVAAHDFTHAVSFHGFSKDGIAVGGGADHEFKARIRDAIDSATDGQYDVYIPTDGSAYAGTSSTNFINWLTRTDNGIQIEQSYRARTDDWQTIASAIAAVYEEKIE